MKTRHTSRRIGAALFWLLACATVAQCADPLPSWNDGKTKQSILDFVASVAAAEGSPHYVPPPDRIATFDNDGTLWAEQPLYFQLFFAIDRVKALASEHPEWQNEEPFKSLLAGDVKAALAGSEHAVMEIIAAAHSGMATDEFQRIVEDWIATAKHPGTELRHPSRTSHRQHGQAELRIARR